MTHSDKSDIRKMKAWPYRQECRGHDPAIVEMTWGRGHSWHMAEEFPLQEDIADERDPAESAPKNTSCHMTLGGQ